MTREKLVHSSILLRGIDYLASTASHQTQTRQIFLHLLTETRPFNSMWAKFEVGEKAIPPDILSFLLRAVINITFKNAFTVTENK
jgi:hypothetical protein